MSSETTVIFDLVVIGGGFGGLSTAALARSAGLKTALLEAHTNLGGCAGYFDRGVYTFDAGATALMGLAKGQPFGDLFDAIGLDFQGVQTPSYRVHLPDRVLDITPRPEDFETACNRAFPGHDQQLATFWRWQASVGNRLFDAAARIPRLPLRSASDLTHNAKILGVSGVLSGLLALCTVEDVMRFLWLDKNKPFRALIAMLLQDTAQAGPETVPFANASACLQAYRLGMSRPRGSMKALAEGIGQRFSALGGDLRTGTIVDEVSRDADGGFTVVTRRRQKLKARQVALNLPLDLASRIVKGPIVRERFVVQSKPVWSAFTAYLAFDRAAVPDSGPLFHQVLQNYDDPIHDGNNALISLSPPDDEGYGPSSVRVATMSTHTPPEDWSGLDRPSYLGKKEEYAARMLKAFGQALPEARDRIVHAEFGSPRSFKRYTRRIDGAVGGPPVSRTNSNLLAVGSDVFGKGIWVVGDSVFPGQGTMATVISAIRVVERMTGRSWCELKTRKQAFESAPCPPMTLAV